MEEQKRRITCSPYWFPGSDAPDNLFDESCGDSESIAPFGNSGEADDSGETSEGWSDDSDNEYMYSDHRVGPTDSDRVATQFKAEFSFSNAFG